MKIHLFQITSGGSRALGLLCAIVIAGTSAAQAASPAAVSNVRAAQRSGTKLVDIHYDLSYLGISPINISIYVSSDSGTTWNVPAATFGGDYGLGVSPGDNKMVVWNAGADWNGQYTTSCRVRVVASPGWKTFGSAPSGLWQTVASSADGTKLVAAVFGGGIYTSADSGATWATTSAPSTNWWSVASSADGTVLAAAVTSGKIYMSGNSGTTWGQPTAGLPVGGNSWRAVACSTNGTKLVAAAHGYDSIFTSVDSGLTWTKQTNGLPSDELWWSSVASSADGTKLVAVASAQGGVEGGIYTSADSGTNWNQQLTGLPPGALWGSVATSADGTKLVVVGDHGVYTSTTSGTSWKQQLGGGWWSSVASSSDGTKLVAVQSPGGIYTSTTSGATWNQETVGLPLNSSWYSVASSADGTRLVAVIRGGGIYRLGW
jgi:hypothetical protein